MGLAHAGNRLTGKTIMKVANIDITDAGRLADYATISTFDLRTSWFWLKGAVLFICTPSLVFRHLFS
jgi:hypothetical protein